MKSFAAPAKHLSELDAGALDKLVAATTDIALILDADGIVRDIALGGATLDEAGCEDWIGQAWVELVSKESRPKVETLLRDARDNAPLAWRQVIHHSAKVGELNLSCAALKLRDAARYRTVGRTVVLGRDLRGMIALQQSVVDAQQEALRDHWKLRDAQSRYRQLFQSVSDAVLIVDAATLKVVEVNPAALQLFGDGVRKLVGATFPVGFEARSTADVLAMLTALRSSGRADEIRAHVADGGGEVLLTGSVFRQETGVLLVIRLSRVALHAPAPDQVNADSVLLKLVQNAPDCMVVTDVNGQIISANEAFVELVQFAN